MLCLELAGLGTLTVWIVVLVWVEAFLELGYRGLDGERLVVMQLERAAGELGLVVEDGKLGCCLGDSCLFNLLVSVSSTYEK